jgi:hypothetical protein
MCRIFTLKKRFLTVLLQKCSFFGHEAPILEGMGKKSCTFAVIGTHVPVEGG